MWTSLCLKNVWSKLISILRYSRLSIVFFLLGRLFFTLGTFLGATLKRWERAVKFLDSKFYAEFLEKKKKKLCSPRSSSDPENSVCSHQQPFNYFSVFADFRTLPDVSGKNNLGGLEAEKFSVTRIFFSPIISRGKVFKKSLFHYI